MTRFYAVRHHPLFHSVSVDPQTFLTGFFSPAGRVLFHSNKRKDYNEGIFRQCNYCNNNNNNNNNCSSQAKPTGSEYSSSCTYSQSIELEKSLSTSTSGSVCGSVIAGVVPKPACEIPEAGEAGAAEIHLAKRHRGGQRRIQPRRGQREGRGPFSEKSSDAAGQLEQRDVDERGETDPEPESRQREAHQRHGCRRELAKYTRKQQRRGSMGLLQPEAFLRGATPISAGPAASENRESLLIVPTKPLHPGENYVNIESIARPERGTRMLFRGPLASVARSFSLVDCEASSSVERPRQSCCNCLFLRFFW